jgi:hypothetical protein
MLGRGRLAIAVAVLLTAAVHSRAQSQGKPTLAMDDQWHFMVAPYFWTSSLEGDVSVKGLPEVPVEKSFSDIWDHFHIGFLGHFEGRKDRWGFATDFMYMDLRAPVASGAPVVGQLGLEAKIKSITVEGLGFYRLATGSGGNKPALDVLVGIRYYGMSNQLNATVRSGGELVGDKKDFDWVDALAGLRCRLPLGSHVALVGRGDIAGFGSKFTWNLEGDLAAGLSQHWALGAGWRHLHVDYDKGSGADRKLFDVAYDGPRAWFAYAW